MENANPSPAHDVLSKDHRVLVLAPLGRDGFLIQNALKESRLDILVCPSMHVFCEEIQKGAAVGAITEEVLKEDGLTWLTLYLDRQPPWSDFPFVVFASRTSSAHTNIQRYERLRKLRNFTIFERPIFPVTLRIAIDSAYRARLHQYALRSHLIERAEREERIALMNVHLENWNQTLEKRVLERTLEVEAASRHIEDSLREKEVLLKEIHHRVKNNLQIISSLLRMQSQRIDHADAGLILQESQNRVLSMAMIHELLYKSQDLRRIPMREYLNMLLTRLFHSYNIDTSRIQLQLAGENVEVGLDTAIPCGLIATELVSNALKYAFPNSRKGILSVTYESRNQRESLRVQDDGVGLPRDLDWRHASSLGFTIVLALTRQIDGSLEVFPSPEGGACFHLSFPSQPQEKVLPLKKRRKTDKIFDAGQPQA